MPILLSLLALLLLGLNPLVSCGKTEEPRRQGLPEAPVRIEPAMAEFGSITFGDRDQATFTITNQSTDPLRLVRIGPFSCQCASATLRFPQRPDRAPLRLDGQKLDLSLSPGESIEVDFVLDTSRNRRPVSRKVGSIPVVFAQHAGRRLEWAADIWTPFAMEPWALDLGMVGVREEASGRVMVTGHDTPRFGLAVDFVQEGWQVKSREVSQPGSETTTYEIVFRAPPELPEGPFQQHFTMHTDLPGAPPIEVPVHGLAQADLAYSPTRLLFDPSQGKRQAKLVLVQRAQGVDLSGLDWSGLELLELEVQPGEPQAIPGGGLRLESILTYRGSGSSDGLRGEILLPTGDAWTPELRIPYHVLPNR